MSIRKNIYDHILKYGIKTYSHAELGTIGKLTSWPRVIRQLRQDGIINYTNNSDNSYTVTEINPYQSKTARAGLSSKDKYRIRNRDGHRCQSCGKGVSDGVKLHIDHKIPMDFGGSNLDDNLWTLCADCNQGKKNLYKDDLNPEIMRLVFKENSGLGRLKCLFELSPNVKYNPSILQGISGTRDWTRSLRLIRKRDNLNIQWFKATEDYPLGYYSNVQ